MLLRSLVLSLYLSASFLSIHLDNRQWFFAPSFGVAAIFRFLLFLQGFHNWTLNPFPHDGCCRYPWRRIVLCAIHGATVENTLFTKTANSPTPSKVSNLHRRKRLIQWSLRTDFWSQIFGIAFSNKRWLALLYALCSSYGTLDKF